jgi:hypothetical protein
MWRWCIYRSFLEDFKPFLSPSHHR